METETTIQVDRLDELEWFNIRLGAIAKLNESEALRARAESIAIVSNQMADRANSLLADIKAKLEVPDGYEPEVRDEHLIFIKTNANSAV